MSSEINYMHIMSTITICANEILSVINPLWTFEMGGIILAMNKCWHDSMVMGAVVNGQSFHMYRLDKGQFNAEHKTFVRFLVLQTYYCYCYVLKNLFNTDYILNYA